MSKFQSPLLNFAETALAKESGAQEGKLGSPWDLGIWLEDRQGPTNILSAPVLE